MHERPSTRGGRVVEDRETLTLAEASALMQRILAGEASEMELATLLGAMAGRGETAPEIAGFAQTLRAAATTLPLTDAERSTIVGKSAEAISQ